jgi:RNA polymerase sigma-70 factor (ECF subfamily)
MIDIKPGDIAGAREWVRTIVRKYVRADEDVEDVTQEAMLRAHQYRESFRGDARYSTWLYRIAANTALIHLRAARRSLGEHVNPDDELPSDFDLHARTVAQLDAARARRAVARMGLHYEIVFERRYAHGMTEPEVAEELGLTVAAVKARATRARNVAIAAIEPAAA